MIRQPYYLPLGIDSKFKLSFKTFVTALANKVAVLVNFPKTSAGNIELQIAPYDLVPFRTYSTGH
jgi:hypothetical protein